MHLCVTSTGDSYTRGCRSSPALGSRRVSCPWLALLYGRAARITPCMDRPASCLWGANPFFSSQFPQCMESLQTLQGSVPGDGPNLGPYPKIIALILHFRKLLNCLGEQRYSRALLQFFWHKDVLP